MVPVTTNQSDCTPLMNSPFFHHVSWLKDVETTWRNQNRHLAPAETHDLLCRLVTQVPYTAQHLGENTGDPRIDVDANWTLGIHGNSPTIFFVIPIHEIHWEFTINGLVDWFSWETLNPEKPIWPISHRKIQGFPFPSLP